MAPELLSADEVIEAWLTQHDEQYGQHPVDIVRESMQINDTMLQLLADGKPVTAQQVAETLDIPVDEIDEAYVMLQKGGFEFDESNRLVGAELTFNPTRHRFILDEQNLYAWCALDTLFLPGLLGRKAQIRSTCPQTGQTISLSVRPDGVDAVVPASTVLSIAVPGVSCARGEQRNTGPTSETCTQMNFFASRPAAEHWIRDHPGVAILTVEEAWRLAYENWIKRRESASG
jgi:alkylmercury lyase